MIDSRYKAVLFDFDGTLYPKTSSIALRLVLNDLRHMRWLFYERVSRHELAGEDFQDAEHFYEKHFANIAKLVDVPVGNVADWYKNKYRTLMTDVLHKYFHKQERVDDVLAALKNRGVITAVYSDYGDVHNRLKAIGINDNIDYEWAAEDMGALKPAIRPLQQIINQLGIAAEELLIVGDRTDTDGALAKNAGADFIYIKKNDKEKLPANFDASFTALTWSDFADRVLS